MSTPKNLINRAWTVVLAGTGINLALGVLYTWSVISKKIPAQWQWSEADRALPYSVACIVFALVMVPAGKMQDKIGPRWVATMGGVLTGIGMIIASQFSSVVGFVIGFGLLAGSGIGLGYAAATPPAVKWFPPQKTGLIAGIVVAGFGLASVYIAPLAKKLLTDYGVSTSMMVFGIAFLVIVAGFSQLLRNPSDEEKEAVAKQLSQKAKPEKAEPQPQSVGAQAAAVSRDYSATEMLKTPQFYLLWLMYMFAAGAGLMIIGKLAKIVSLQAASEAGFVLVALLAIGNAAGRVTAGVMSDKIGRTRTMLIVFLFQAVLMFALSFVSNFYMLIAFSMLLGFNYGSNLSVFPSVTKDWFGLKNFGVNYGLVFTAWGAGGLVLPWISGAVFDSTGKFNIAYIIAAVLLVIAALITFVTKAPKNA